jgi:hypothetical protein
VAQKSKKQSESARTAASIAEISPRDQIDRDPLFFDDFVCCLVKVDIPKELTTLGLWFDEDEWETLVDAYSPGWPDRLDSLDRERFSDAELYNDLYLRYRPLKSLRIARGVQSKKRRDDLRKTGELLKRTARELRQSRDEVAILTLIDAIGYREILSISKRLDAWSAVINRALSSAGNARAGRKPNEERNGFSAEWERLALRRTKQQSSLKTIGARLAEIIFGEEAASDQDGDALKKRAQRSRRTPT